MATETLEAPARNEVCLAGRLPAPPKGRTLPSGDALVTFRLVVRRPPGSRGPTVDTIDCAGWTAAVRRAAGGWAAGDVIEVTGALRRRFWRTGGGALSRTEVEVAKARRIARAAPPSAGAGGYGTASSARMASW